MKKKHQIEARKWPEPLKDRAGEQRNTADLPRVF